MSVVVGEKAPEFTLLGSGGKSYSLSDYAGKPVVFFFYTGDNTAVCTKQLFSYNNELAQFNGLGAQVLGN
jgi:peroxiredoxin